MNKLTKTYLVAFDMCWLKSQAAGDVTEFLSLVKEYLDITKTRIGFVEPFKKYSLKLEKELLKTLVSGEDFGLGYLMKCKEIGGEIYTSLSIPNPKVRRGGLGRYQGEAFVPEGKVDEFTESVRCLVTKSSPFYARIQPTDVILGKKGRSILKSGSLSPTNGVGGLCWRNWYSQEYADFLKIQDFQNDWVSCDIEQSGLIQFKMNCDWEEIGPVYEQVNKEFRAFADPDIFYGDYKARLPEFLQKDLENTRV